MAINALASWYGSNRMLSRHVGEELSGCSWVGVPFSGGMSELQHITARTILVSDLHRHVINLARVVASGANIARKLSGMPFHEDVLSSAQLYCSVMETQDTSQLTEADRWDWAVNYFICCWMGRSGKAGTTDEFKGGPAIRWNAGGGDSNVRYRSAIRGLVEWRRIMQRCTFETTDVFEFLARCIDQLGHGLYLDPPFPGVGRKYRFNAGKTDVSEREWHTRLRDDLLRFTSTRVVLRFYDHPLIRELYPDSTSTRWHWRFLTGRDQANNDKAEVLIMNQPSLVQREIAF